MSTPAGPAPFAWAAYFETVLGDVDAQHHKLVDLVNMLASRAMGGEGIKPAELERILDALADGKLVVALMTKGHFTKSGHFIVLRGVQDEKILVADPASYRRSQKVWDLSIILNEASRRAGAGGPFCMIE